MQTFLEMSLVNVLMASLLALLAAGAGLCCRPALRHTLWLLVLLKLLTPPLLSIPITCPSAVEAFWVQAQREPIRSSIADPESADLPLAALAQGTIPEEEDGAEEVPSPVTPANLLPPPTGRVALAGLASMISSGWSVTSALRLAFAVWLLGTVVWFLVAAVRIHAFHRLLAHGRAAPAPLQEQARQLAEQLGLARCPTVWLVPGQVSPLLWAWGGQRRLVVPAGLLARLGPEQRASLFAHELAHARRRDHWVRWLELVTLGLYWWLPVAWWARRQLQQAEEECCDAWVVWTLPASAKAYAKALLQTVDFLDARPALPPVASGIGHVRLLKRRLQMIVRQPLCPRLPWPVHLGIGILGLLVLPLAPERLAAQSSKPQPVEVSDGLIVARAEQDSSNRDMERRLRALEERMDRLLQKLDGPRGEPSGSKSAEAERAGKYKAAAEEKARAAAEKARARQKEMAEKAQARQKEMAEKTQARQKEMAEKTKEKAHEFEQSKLSPEQLDRLKKEIHEKVSKALDPERMKELQKRIEDTVDQNINPARMEEIQRRVSDALKQSSQKVNEALKKSAEELERAKSNLQKAQQYRVVEKPKTREGDRSNLERRVDRLEQKMDRVLEALEKQGKR